MTTSIYPALTGGILLGVAALSLLKLTGRIAGISGLVYGAVTHPAGQGLWRVAFLLGLPLGAALAGGALDSAMPQPPAAGWAVIVAGGLLVGFGTRLGSGCTSGHGVCGIARLSPRSMIATATFVGVAMLTTTVVRHGLGMGQ